MVVVLLDESMAEKVNSDALKIVLGNATITINAAWGLGEAVVGGQVTPDSFTVDRRSGLVEVHRSRGSSGHAIRRGSSRPRASAIRSVAASEPRSRLQATATVVAAAG